jgi:hypothetical protein
MNEGTKERNSVVSFPKKNERKKSIGGWFRLSMVRQRLVFAFDRRHYDVRIALRSSLHLQRYSNTHDLSPPTKNDREKKKKNTARSKKKSTYESLQFYRRLLEYSSPFLTLLRLKTKTNNKQQKTKCPRENNETSVSLATTTMTANLRRSF